MAKEAWTRREKTIVRRTAPTGQLDQIRPIDPEFWDEQGNIEIFRYQREHDKYLEDLRCKNGVLYHYTTLDALHGIVKEGALWASDLRHMNDRAELWYALQNMYSLALKLWGQSKNSQPLRAIFDPGSVAQFIVCLSQSRDQLSQWRAYGRRIGVSIAFERMHLAHAASARSGTLVDCAYRPPEEFDALQSDIVALLESLSKPSALNKDGELIDMTLQDELTQRAIQIATSIKHPSFFEEQEVRLVFPMQSYSEDLQFRSSPQSLTPYIKVDIDGRRNGLQTKRKFSNALGMLEVIVWPSDADDHILDTIDMLFSGVGHVLINRSSSPYRT